MFVDVDRRPVFAGPEYHGPMNGFGALELLARAGFLVKGVLYLVVGALALQVAGKFGGRVTGMRGAFTTVLAQPFGRTLLLVAGVGLLGYAAWRLLQALFDPDRLGHNWRGLAIRVSFVARGVVHAALGLQAFRLYRGLSASSGTSGRGVATEAFEWPLGDWLVVLAGLGLIGFAVHQVYAAITCRLERDLDVAEMRREAGEWAVRLTGSAWRHAPSSLRCWDGASSSRAGLRLRLAPRRRHCASSAHNREAWAPGCSAQQQQVSSPAASTRSSTRAICTSDSYTDRWSAC
jgi:hypothetical protein